MVTIKTRRVLAAASDKRFVKRYNMDVGGDKPGFLFEAVANTKPFLDAMPFLPAVRSGNPMAERVRTAVKKISTLWRR